MNKRPADTQNNQKEVISRAPTLLRDLWLGTCARYTVLCLCLLLISAIVADSLTVTYVDSIRFFLLLPFALCVTLAARTRRSDKLPTGAKCTLHPILVLGGFFLFCYLPFQIDSKPSGQQVLLFLLLAILVYCLFMGIFCLITRHTRRKQIDDTPYVSQFSKK